MEPFTAFEEFDERDWDTGPDGTVRFGLVGLGWFASDFALPAIESCEYAEVTVGVSSDAGKAAAFADEHDLTVGIDYDAFHDGEATEEYDAVYVATPNALHLPHIEAAAELGKDIVCEKPIEATVERAERAVEAAADVTLMTAYRMQFDPAMRRVRELIADGYVGEPVQAEGAFTYTILEEGDAEQWRLDGDLAGGGSLYDVGVYPLNTLRYLLDAAPERVQGALASPDAGFEEVDEHAAFVVEYDDGTQALCRSSYRATGGTDMFIEGTEGSITLENCFAPTGPRTVELERNGHTARYEGLAANEMAEQFDYFAHCVLTGEEPGPDGEEGADDVAALYGVKRSAETGERVDL
jgi:xylose dehydrogenase (NAD/NADP)